MDTTEKRLDSVIERLDCIEKILADIELDMLAIRNVNTLTIDAIKSALDLVSKHSVFLERKEDVQSQLPRPKWRSL